MTLPLWIQILTIALPAVVSVFAGIWSARSAGRAKAAEHEAARLRALEERIAQKKFELYQPMLEVLGDMMTPGKTEAALAGAGEVMSDFQTFVSVWGSDDAVRAFYKFRVASSTNPPSMITIRLVSDFMIEARRDLAWPNTKLTGREVMGMRINETTPQLEEALTLDFDALARKYEWHAPWYPAPTTSNSVASGSP
ncbi:hypothetical protein [Cryobacterium sp. PH31-L1]|uniref:hypothetical protein n=1 Tax=Cryobacterium sp. PH31-L1 TaxID=3046199 RepID=UPI0024B92EED|nr:hypothetical protein [Cryobacterium sp. PH31-L1]MDJ0379199.1 hypothetical protein [Cryobacterium sp. PH31-L1]